MSAEGRVENQKLNQTAALLSVGWVFDFQLDSFEKNLTTLPVFTFNTYTYANENTPTAIDTPTDSAPRSECERL